MIGQELRSLMPCGVATKISPPCRKKSPKTDQVKQVKMMASGPSGDQNTEQEGTEKQHRGLICKVITSGLLS